MLYQGKNRKHKYQGHIKRSKRNNVEIWSSSASCFDILYPDQTCNGIMFFSLKLFHSIIPRHVF